MMKLAFLFITALALTSCSTANPTPSEHPKATSTLRAKINQNVSTKEGKIFQINADGTWQEPIIRPRWVTFRSPDRTLSFKYDSTKWLNSPQKITEEADISLIYHRGEAYGLGLFQPNRKGNEEIARTLALSNAKSVDPKARLIQGNFKKIHGDMFYVTIIEAKVNGMQISYYNATYSGQKGTYQLISFTTVDNFKDYYNEMVELTSGIYLR